MSGTQLARAVVGDESLWLEIVELVESGVMPPASYGKQPSRQDRRALVDWIKDTLRKEAESRAGDPGPVVMRRLTRADLSYTLKDLTGTSRHWVADFPADGSGGEGFTNTGQTLQMSAGQIEKYLSLARQVADHSLLLPSGFVFSDAPMVSMNDANLVDLTLTRLDAFHSRHGLPLVRSQFTDAIKALVERGDFFQPTPRTIPKPVMPKDDRVVKGLSRIEIDRWHQLWNDFSYVSRPGRAHKIDFLRRYLSGKPYRRGSDPLLEENILAARAEYERLRKNRQLRQGKGRTFKEPVLRMSVADFAHLIDYIHPLSANDKVFLERFSFAKATINQTINISGHIAYDVYLDQVLSDDELEMLWQELNDPKSRICQAIPCTISDASRASWKMWSQKDVASRQVDFLPGIFRFAKQAWRRPLTESEKGALRTLFEQARSAGQSENTAGRWLLIRILSSPYFIYRAEYPPPGTGPVPLSGYERANRLSYFLWSSVPDRELYRAAEAGELFDKKLLMAQAKRMMQHPHARRLAAEFFGQWLQFYGFDRRQDGPDKERFPKFTAAVRKGMYEEALSFCHDLVRNNRSIPSLLTAEHTFLDRSTAAFYGVSVPSVQVVTLLDEPGGVLVKELADSHWQRGKTPVGSHFLKLGGGLQELVLDLPKRPITRDHSLQLWVRVDPAMKASSLVVDWRLMPRNKSSKSSWQSKRWQSNDFDIQGKADGVLVKKLPANGAWTVLRISGSELFRAKRRKENGAVLTGVRLRCADGLVHLDGLDVRLSPWSPEAKQRRHASGLGTCVKAAVGDAPRGGILGMGAILSHFANPLRTSPVRRGHWICEELLGIHLPEAPDGVPQLPDDERNDAGLSQRQLLAKHREQASCASCHARFDAFGIALEGFDAAGAFRQADVNGTPIDSVDQLSDGTRLDGFHGLRDYLKQPQQQQRFVRQLSRKLLGYALGRSVTFSDSALLEDINRHLQVNGHRFHDLVYAIVTSKQFLHHRGLGATP